MTFPIRFTPKQHIAFDGDSLTALRTGPGLSQWPWLRISNNHRSWADVFSELLFAWRPELNLKYSTVAIGGSNTRNLKERFDRTIGKLTPDWIFMTMGSNDLSHDVPLDEFEANLRGYIEGIQAWGGQLVFVYGFKAMPNSNERNIHKANHRGPYYSIEEKLADEYDHVIALNVGEGFDAKAKALYDQYEGHTVYSDGNHFSHLGAMILAGEVLQACGIVNPATPGVGN